MNTKNIEKVSELLTQLKLTEAALAELDRMKYSGTSGGSWTLDISISHVGFGYEGGKKVYISSALDQDQKKGIEDLLKKFLSMNLEKINKTLEYL